MSPGWSLVALAAVAVLAPAVTHLAHRWPRTRRRAAGRADDDRASDGDLQTVRSAISCLDRIRADLQVVVADGPLGAGRLAELGLGARLDRLDALLKNQLLHRAVAVQEHARQVLRHPYPSDQADDVDTATWQQLREAIGRGATQQAAAHAALDSVRDLGAELRGRELELAGRVFTSGD